jgi:hypothetical protein
MNKIKTFAVLVLIAVIALVGLDLTIHAGDAGATNKGDLLFFNRYFTTSRTPITDLNTLTGSGSSGTSGQIRINDGTDWESKTCSGAFTLASTGVATLSVNVVGTNNIIDNTVSSADILNGTIAATDLASSAVTSPKIAIANVQATNLFTNTVSLIIAAGTVSNTATVESGSVLLSVFPRIGFSNDYTITNTVFSGTSWIVNTDAHPADMTVDGLFIRP